MWWPEPEHPVWQAQMFTLLSTEELDALRSHIVTKTFRDNDAMLTATGIPNVVMQHKKFEALTTAIEKLTDKVVQLHHIVEEMPATLRSQAVAEQVALTRADLTELSQGLFSAIHNSEARILSHTATAVNVESPSTVAIVNQPGASNYLTFCYNSVYHYVPEGFRFPKCTANSIWLVWHFGVKAHKIGPLRQLRSKYRRDIDPGDRHLIDKAALIVDTVLRLALRLGVLRESEDIEEQNQEAIWSSAFKEYLLLLYGAPTVNKDSFRGDEKYYTTLYNVHTKQIDGMSQFERNFAAKYASTAAI